MTDQKSLICFERLIDLSVDKINRNQVAEHDFSSSSLFVDRFESSEDERDLFDRIVCCFATTNVKEMKNLWFLKKTKGEMSTWCRAISHIFTILSENDNIFVLCYCVFSDYIYLEEPYPQKFIYRKTNYPSKIMEKWFKSMTDLLNKLLLECADPFEVKYIICRGATNANVALLNNVQSNDVRIEIAKYIKNIDHVRSTGVSQKNVDLIKFAGLKTNNANANVYSD